MRLSVFVLMMIVMSACSSTQDPVITVAGARLGEVTGEALTLQIALQLDNPNSEPLELLEFKYRVEVDGRHVYSGTRAAGMTLEQLSTRGVDLPAVVAFNRPPAEGWSPQSLPPAAEFRIQGTLKYQLPGAISQTLFDTGVRRPSAGFNGKGTASLHAQ